MCKIEEISCVTDISLDKKYEPLAIDMLLDWVEMVTMKDCLCHLCA